MKAAKITEKRNLASMELDQMKTTEILEIMNKEDAKVIAAVNKEIPNISRAIEIIAAKMAQGGRLFYVGAGTSGRLGVLDAVECIPTFSIEEGIVVGILAGGAKAMFKSQEDIEDNALLAAEEIRENKINQLDTVVGIAASGNTSFVLGAIEEAKKLGAATVALVCNQPSTLGEIVDIAITPIVGPEVLTGSTRMKAGTAQKIILNMISTTVMIKLGKVYSNLMVDLQAINHKLRERAKRIFIDITKSDLPTALTYLEQANYNVKEAIILCERGCSLEEARELLVKHGGHLRAIIE